ncbi:hypothetical protein B0T19DRAFT_255693 [Cercophora scortea]|uniref:Uncharacterized protein n=1 Tax=Cercophora scortea TaxID=314031 RepID=A0AAE0I9E6_9PEZI|nr:hypothetical protein B0T19DRAFT_255693 [Cercophora scortea]
MPMQIPMPRKNMSTSEKRRLPPGSGNSPPRVSRGSKAASSSSATSGASANSNANTNARNGSSVIAPPPRAALSGASSPAPDEYRSRDGTTASTQAPAPNLGKDAGGTASAAAAAAPTQVMKDKDARIAELEIELSIMESEFQRELDKLSTAESETASYWQTKYGSLKQQYQRADADLQLVQSELESRSAERDELRAECETMKRDLRGRDNEIRALRSQVRGLKEWVSTSTRSDGLAQTSDEVFGDGMTRLGNGLQNWVLVNFRRAKIDLSNADEATMTELGRLVPAYQDIASTSKVHLLQSVVSRILVELVFDAYFVGLTSEQAQQLAQVEALLGSFATSPEPISQWRSMTLTILKKEADQRMQTETSSLTEAVVTKVNSILDAITDTTSTDARDQALAGLVAVSIELSRLLVVQKALFRVTMPEILPHQKTMFDATTMEDMGGEDEDSLAEREICCVTFPGIIKRGDESGGHLQYRNVISKARVLCSPE